MARRPAKPPSPAPAHGPAYTDAALVARCADRLRRGASWSAAAECEGLDRHTLRQWVDRAEREGAAPELVEAARMLSVAHADATYRAEVRLYNGDVGPAYWLQCRRREDWSKRETVAVETVEPASKADVLAALGRVREVADGGD